MVIVKKIITNILVAIYQPFWMAVILSFFTLFFYLFAFCKNEAGKGIKESVKIWVAHFKKSSFFRKLCALSFCTSLILFRTVLYRSLWVNPLSDVMGGWWIWKTSSDGTVTLTTECFENILLMFPFTILLMWTMKEKLVKKLSFRSIVFKSTKIAFYFSLAIEFSQLLLRLGTFQISDIFYNTVGGCLGGIVYGIGWTIAEKRK